MIKTVKEFKKDLKKVKEVFVFVRLNEYYGDYFKVSKKEVMTILKLNPNNEEIRYLMNDNGTQLFID